MPDLSVPTARLRGAGPEALAVGVLTAVAFGLHLSQLHQSLFGDEVLAYHDIAGHTLGQTVHTVAHGVESSPPLFFILAWLSAKLADPSVWIRLPTLLFGTATVPVIYLLGRETVGRRGALIGAAIAVVSPFATYYGVEARPYGTLEFCVALSSLALLRAVRTGRRREWVLFTFATAAAAYTHYTAIFVLVVEVLWAGWVCRGELRPLLLACAAAVLLYVPWLPSLHGSDLGAYALLEPLTVSHVLTDSLRPVLGYPYASLVTIPTVPGLAAVGLCALGGAACLIRDRVRPVSPERSRGEDGGIPAPVVLLGLLALATPVGLLLTSLLSTDLWGPRDLIASAPAQVLVLAGLIAALPRRAMGPAVLVVLGFLVFGTVRAISPTDARPPYRTVARYLDAHATPQDPVYLPTAFLTLDDAIPAQTRRPHRFIDAIPKTWPARPAGSLTFVVFDDAASKVLTRADLHPPGDALIRRRNYGGLVAFQVLTFRAR